MSKPSIISPPHLPAPVIASKIIVAAKVPSRFFWEKLNNDFNNQFSNNQDTEEVLNHYAWLVRTTSWSYGIDWDIVSNTITTQVPFVINDKILDTAADLNVKGNSKLKIDPISDILLDILKSVTLERVVSHFEK